VGKGVLEGVLGREGERIPESDRREFSGAAGRGKKIPMKRLKIFRSLGLLGIEESDGRSLSKLMD